MPKTAKRRTHSHTYSKRPLVEWVFFYLLIAGVIYAAVYLFITAKRGPFPGGVVPITAISATYKGRLPCADCSGIDATITLYRENTYTQTYEYLEKGTHATIKGTWNIRKGTPMNPSAWVYELTRWGPPNTTYYLVKENQLIPLDDNLSELPAPQNVPLIKQ